MKREPILLSWSSGKDSTWALHTLRQERRLDVRGLFVTTNGAAERVAMHGVREELLRRQAESTGLPLHVVPLPHPCTNDAYEACVGRALAALAPEVSGIAFGDLFLEDVRAYRERQVGALGLGAHFPLWGRATGELAREMLRGGLRATLTCIDPELCPREFAGREFDEDFLDALPAGIDACGEHGEFHTFAHTAPVFDRPLLFERGANVERGGFLFTDLIPVSERP